MSNPETRQDLLSSLGSLDRATLYLWRALNMIGWSVPGVLVAIIVHWVIVQGMDFDQTAAFHRAGEFPRELGAGPTAQIIAWRLVVALIGGLAIGQNVGHKVWTRQPLVAAMAALGYAVYSMVALEHSLAQSAEVAWGVEPEWVEPNSIGRTLLHDAAILSVAPIAALTAKRIQRIKSEASTLVA